MAFDFGHERYYNEHGHKFTRPKDPIIELGRNWAYALRSPAYILNLQLLYWAFYLL